MAKKGLFMVMFGFLGFLLISVSLVSCTKKTPEERIPIEKRMTLDIINNTGGIIEKVVFSPSKGEAYSQTCSITKGGSYTATLAQAEYYDIILVDTKGHNYGKTGCRWINGSETLTITDKDFVPQGLWDTLKKTLGL
jgi:hypothetical protein